jgi:hypothetical protein
MPFIGDVSPVFDVGDGPEKDWRPKDNIISTAIIPAAE